jgi:hypothetical protein
MVIFRTAERWSNTSISWLLRHSPGHVIGMIFWFFI